MKGCGGEDEGLPLFRHPEQAQPSSRDLFSAENLPYSLSRARGPGRGLLPAGNLRENG